MNTSNVIKQIINSEGLLLAAIPFVGTYLTFLFEYGYLSYYDVPISIVQIDFTRIVSASSAIVFSLVYIFVAFMFITIIIRSDNIYRKILLSPFVSAFLVGILAYLIPYSTNLWWLCGVIFLGHLSIELIAPFFRKDKTISYVQALTKQVEDENKTTEKSPTTLKDRFALLLTLSFIVSLIGLHFASEKDSYWVIDTHPDMIVVEIYGNTIILKEYDAKTKIIGSKLLLLNRDSDKEIYMNKVKTGPLKKTNSVKS